MGVGSCCLSLGRMQDCGEALDEAIALSAGGVSDFLQGLSLTIKGMLRFVTGDLESGMALIEQARRIQERVHDHEGGGMALSFLAQMSFAKGDLARALVLYGQALESLATIGDQPEIGLALLGLAAVEATEGRAERAVAVAAAAHALSERAGIVIAHPMDPGVVTRIDALKASIPKGRLDGLVANASVLSPAAVLEMVTGAGAAEFQEPPRHA